MSRTRHLGRKAAGLLATSALALSMGLAPHGAAAAPAGVPPSPETKHHKGSSLGEKRDYDARQAIAAAGKKAVSQRAARASSRPATQQLRRSLGDQALVEMDGTTGTPRIVARLDGFLTGRSSKP